MKTIYSTSGIAIVLFLITFSSINGQVKTDAYSINIKIGAYNWIGDDIGLVRGGEFSMLHNNSLFSLDYYNCMEIMSVIKFNQIEFLAGREIVGKYFRLQLQGGLGTIWGVKEGKWVQDTWFGYYERDEFSTFGIPLKLGIKTVPKRFISIGVDFQANLNFEQPVYMTVFSIEFGKFRSTVKRERKQE